MEILIGVLLIASGFFVFLASFSEENFALLLLSLGLFFSGMSFLTSQPKSEMEPLALEYIQSTDDYLVEETGINKITIWNKHKTIILFEEGYYPAVQKYVKNLDKQKEDLARKKREQEALKYIQQKLKDKQ